MKPVALPTLTQMQVQQSMAQDLRQRIIDAQYEATTGFIADLSTHMRGDVGQVQQLEKLIADNETYLQAIGQAETRFTSVQLVLDRFSDVSGEFGIGAAAAAARGDQTLIAQEANAAEASFLSLIDALNTQSSGRYLFSGARVDTPAFQNGQDILDAVKTAIDGNASATDALADVAAYFAPSGGYETLFDPTGTTTNASTIAIGPERRVGHDMTATSQEIKDVVMNLAIVAVAHDSTVSSEIADEMMAEAAGALTVANTNMITKQAELGVQQQEISERRTQNAAETFAYQQSLAALTARDPVEASVELQALTNQLAVLFETTGTIAQLSYVNFFR